ncbi:MAG: hypothetical protein IJI50_08570 [Ruminococcus sp.]|nr:hypothetical protein [Ruminococcus sp.]
MDYLVWADEYLEEARRILDVIEKKKTKLKEGSLSRDDRKTLNDTIISYRVIYRELLGTAQRLRERAGEQSHAA